MNSEAQRTEVGAGPGMIRRIGRFIGKIFRATPETRHERKSTSGAADFECRQPTESEIDEAERESFPASDPPALALEDGDRSNKKGQG